MVCFFFFFVPLRTEVNLDLNEYFEGETFVLTGYDNDG